MNANTLPGPIDLQSTDILADYRDPSHPHFPSDLEAQPSSREYYKYTPFVSKKAVWIVGSIILVLALFTIAIVTGVKIGKGQVAKPSLVNTTAPVAIETISVATTVLSTTLFPLHVGTNATTITTTNMLPVPTPPPALVKFFPIASAFLWTPPSSLAIPKPPKDNPPKE